MPFIVGFLILGKVLKPKVNRRFLIDYSVHHCTLGGIGPGPTEMTSLNTFQREKLIGFRAYDYVMLCTERIAALF